MSLDDGWIACGERMPPLGESVLLLRRNGTVISIGQRGASGGFDLDGGGWWRNDSASHWMPLPAPPRATEPR